MRIVFHFLSIFTSRHRLHWIPRRKLILLSFSFFYFLPLFSMLLYNTLPLHRIFSMPSCPKYIKIYLLWYMCVLKLRVWPFMCPWMNGIGPYAIANALNSATSTRSDANLARFRCLLHRHRACMQYQCSVLLRDRFCVIECCLWVVVSSRFSFSAGPSVESIAVHSRSSIFQRAARLDK